MSASGNPELDALLMLESGHGLDAAIELELQHTPALAGDVFSDAAGGEKFGRATQEPEAPARMVITPEYRSRICQIALPQLAEGEDLGTLAAEFGIVASTLRGWLITFDEPAYNEALAGQIGVKLAIYSEKLDECVRQVEEAHEKTMIGEKILVGDGMSTKYQLIGPELAKVTRARAGVLSDAARLLHWQAERRLPKLFAGDVDQSRGPMRATFSFVINGQQAPTGRVIVAASDRPRIEQHKAGPESFDIKPLARTQHQDSAESDAVIHSQAPCPDGVLDLARPGPAPGEKAQR